MKVIVLKGPKFLNPFLRMLFGIKKQTDYFT